MYFPGSVLRSIIRSITYTTLLSSSAVCELAFQDRCSCEVFIIRIFGSNCASVCIPLF